MKSSFDRLDLLEGSMTHSQQPTISVIIPVYNGERSIRATVQSVLQQSFANFELIVVNDGSTDRTLAQLEQIEDERLRVLSFENAGVAETRNRGIAAAKGDYLSFLDADDLWTQNKLERQLRALEETPTAAVAYSWTNYIDESDRFIHTGWHFNENGHVFVQLFQCCFIENGSNILLRRSVLDCVEGFDRCLTPTEDWDFYLRLAEKFQFVCVPEAQILYRVSRTSQSANVLKMERAGTAVLRQTMGRARSQLKTYRAKSWADFYSYLFDKAFAGAVDRPSRWLALKIFARGMWATPQMYEKVATRRILKLCWQVVVEP